MRIRGTAGRSQDGPFLIINQFNLNEQSAYNQKNSPGTVNGGGGACGFFMSEWVHLRR